MNLSSRQSLWMLAASLLFACMGVCVKLASAQHSAAEIVLWRSLVSLLLMVALVRWQRVSLRTPCWRLQLFRGTSGFVSLALFFTAIVLLPLATAVTLNYTSPLFLAVFLTVISGVHFRWPLLLALGVGLAGVSVLLRPTFQSEQLLGGLAGLGSGLMAGLAYFNVRELGSRGEPESRTVFYFSLVSTVLGAAWVVLAGGGVPALNGVPMLLGVGIFATLAQLSMTRAYRLGKTIVSASLAYTTVIFASLFGMLLWGEQVGVSGALGIALIILSGVIVTLLSRGTPESPEPDAAGEPV
jgi:S-adenosylmethionine uptake transporter